MLGHHRHASETPFKWCFAGGDGDGRLKVVIGPSLHSSNPSLVLVQPRKTHPFITERLLIGRKESNQTKISPHQLKKNVVKGALAWYGKLTWESAHAWNLIILCLVIVWGMTFIFMLHLSFYALPSLIYDVMYEITTIP